MKWPALPFLVLVFLANASPIAQAAPTILVIPIPLKGSDPRQTSKLAHQLQGLLETPSRKVVIDRGPVSTAVPGILAEALKSARDLQFNFEEEKAAALLKDAIARFDKGQPELTDMAYLAEAHLFLAACHKNGGRERAMAQALYEAARLSLSLIPNDWDFPPSLLAEFNRVRDQLWNSGSFSTLLVDSRPAGARIFVNGKYKGQAPLKLTRLPLGTHYIHGIKGGKVAVEKIDVHESARRLVLHLDPAGQPPQGLIRRGAVDEWIRTRLAASKITRGVGIAALKAGKVHVQLPSIKKPLTFKGKDFSLVGREIAAKLDEVEGRR